MGEEKITLELDRDIPVIRELNMQINHDNVEEVTKEYEAIMDLDVLHTATGAIYVKRLAQIMRRERNDNCVLCGSKRLSEAVLCEECLAKYKNSPMFSDQRSMVRDIMNMVKPKKEEEVRHGSQYIGQMEAPNRASKLVLFFTVLVLFFVGYILCTRVFFQEKSKANFASASYTPDEVAAEYEISIEESSQRYIAQDIDVEFVQATIPTDDTGVTGYRILVDGESTGMYMIIFVDEREKVRAVTVYACEDNTLERCFGGALLQLTNANSEPESTKEALDASIGQDRVDWNQNYYILYQENSIILSSKSFFGNMGEAIKAVIGLEF